MFSWNPGAIDYGSCGIFLPGFMLGVEDRCVGILPNLTPSFKFALGIPSDDVADDRISTEF